MRSIAVRGVLFALATGLLVTVSCSGGKDEFKLCCNLEYPDNLSTERNYCGDVAMVAGDYIFEPDVLADRTARRDEIAALLGKLDHCGDKACIEITVDTTATADAFDAMFLARLVRSDSRETIAENDKPDAIKCGLRHAIETKLE